MMTIVMLRLIVDFGLVVLIWIVQLIVYPSFNYYKTENLITWHRKYTSLMGYIVGPLMLLQLGITIYQATQLINPIILLNLLIISVIWISTFLQFIPIHNSISNGHVNKEMLIALVKKNWLRTILWTFLLILNITAFWKV